MYYCNRKFINVITQITWKKKNGKKGRFFQNISEITKLYHAIVALCSYW